MLNHESIFDLSVDLKIHQLNDEKIHTIEIMSFFEFEDSSGTITMVPGSSIPFDSDSLVYQDSYIPVLPDILFEIYKYFVGNDIKPIDGGFPPMNPPEELRNIIKIELHGFFYDDKPFVKHIVEIEDWSTIVAQAKLAEDLFVDEVLNKLYNEIEKAQA